MAESVSETDGRMGWVKAGREEKSTCNDAGEGIGDLTVVRGIK